MYARSRRSTRCRLVPVLVWSIVQYAVSRRLIAHDLTDAWPPSTSSRCIALSSRCWDRRGWRHRCCAADSWQCNWLFHRGSQFYLILPQRVSGCFHGCCLSRFVCLRVNFSRDCWLPAMFVGLCAERVTFQDSALILFVTSGHSRLAQIACVAPAESWQSINIDPH